MSLPTNSAEEAREVMAEGATLIDVREGGEHARVRVSGARHAPMSRLDEAELGGARIMIFDCRSGIRTQSSAAPLAAKAGDACNAYVVEGRLAALRTAGLPVQRDASQPLELKGQVQIGAGGLVLAGTALGLTVSQWFLAIPATVGAGLVLAGVTGMCGMATLLAAAPWNRRARARHGKADASI